MADLMHMVASMANTGPSPGSSLRDNAPPEVSTIDRQLQDFQQQLGQLNIPQQIAPTRSVNAHCGVPHSSVQLSQQTPAGHRSIHPLVGAGEPPADDHQVLSALQQAQSSNSNLAMDMETLMGLTVRSKQFRPHEFAAIQNLPLSLFSKIVLQISTLNVEFQHKQILKKIKLSIA